MPISTNASGEPWLEGLGERLPDHAAILRRLTEHVRGDSRVVQLLVGCSVGRGIADALSDLDCHLSLEAEAWPGGLDLIEPLVRSAGEVVDLLHHRTPGGGDDHRRTAVQYANGVQLDLMVSPVTACPACDRPTWSSSTGHGRSSRVRGIRGRQCRHRRLSASGVFWAGGCFSTPTSTCAAARPGKRISDWGRRAP